MATTTPCIDEEINKCLVLLHNLRSQKNLSLPIFRLPPEILFNVFIHGAREYHKRNDRPTLRAPHWVNVSYVCRHWRNVALNCPTLWTYHFTASLRWTEELLARSKQASLKICIYIESPWSRSWWSNFVGKVLNHAERIQELRLYVPETALPAVLSLYAPRLQILDIYTWECPSKQTFMISSGDALPLRTLKLTCCPLPWYSTFNLSGVTTLFLCHIPPPSQQNIMEFHVTLSRMQALTVLHLYRALPSARDFLSSGAFGVSPLKVSLPCLARLFVHAPISTVIALLSCVDLPLKTQLTLEIESEDSKCIDDYVQITSIVAQRFSQSKDLTSSSLAIRPSVIQFLYSIFTFGCGPTNLSKLYSTQDCNVHLTIPDDQYRIRSDIYCSIPSTYVQTLHITRPPFSPDFWRKVLGHFDKLRHMRLSDGYMPDLVSLLTCTADGPVEAPRGDTTSDRDSNPGHTFVPALEELELCGITFAFKDNMALGQNAISKKSLDALSTRKALHLTMIDCHYGEEDESGVEDSTT